MRSVQTQGSFPLSAVKPLERVAQYRGRCLEAVRRALASGARRRERSPVTGSLLQPAGEISGFLYSRCPDTGSLFLAELPERKAWSALLKEVSLFRRAPEAFHLDLAQSRVENVYRPKLEWVSETLRLHDLQRPRALEVVTGPSDLTQFLRESGAFSEVVTLDEMELSHGGAGARNGGAAAQAAFLFESLDRVDDPESLLKQVSGRMEKDGLLFVTGLVASGFDMAALGLDNLYLYPPDRANCFTLSGLRQLLEKHGFTLAEVSTPGVLDVQIVQEHLRLNPGLKLSLFEKQVLEASPETRAAFQSFLQEWGLSSFARMAARKKG